MLGLVLKALKIDEPVQYIPRYIRNMNAFHANGTKVVVVDELLEYTLISFLFTMYSLENNRSEENVTRCILNSSEYAEDWLRYKISKGKL